MFIPGVKERRKPPKTSLEKSHRRRPRPPATTSLLNDVRFPARRRAGANAHRLLSCESELRIRSCGFPPDLRVSGARQRILRPSTPVETSRPLERSIVGPAATRVKRFCLLKLCDSLSLTPEASMTAVIHRYGANASSTFPGRNPNVPYPELTYTKPPATIGAGPFIDPPFARTPFTVAKVRLVSNVQTIAPSFVE